MLLCSFSLAQETQPRDQPDTPTCEKWQYQTGYECTDYTLEDVPEMQRFMIAMLIGGAVDALVRSDLSVGDAIDFLEWERDRLDLDATKPAEKFAIDVFDLFIDQMDFLKAKEVQRMQSLGTGETSKR